MSDVVESRHTADLLVQGTSIYKLLNDGHEVILNDGNGRIFSDQTSIYWDVVKAVAGETGFQFLVEGEKSLVGRYQVWATDDAGVITEKSRWLMSVEMLDLGYEDIFNADLNQDGVIGELPLNDDDGDGLLDGSSVYKIIKGDQRFTLTNSRGRTFTDESSRYWNVVKAVSTDNGFALLVKGESYLAGRYQVWRTDDAGVITDKTRWKTGNQMLSLGYEETFDLDLNEDDFTGEPPAVDVDGDGLIDKSVFYKILNGDQGIILSNSEGRTFSDQSSNYWDVVKAVVDETDTGETIFKLLVKGERAIAGKYQLWTTDDAGVITDKSRWKTGNQMLVLGYEETFKLDLNEDGFTGEPPAHDLNGDGLIDGSRLYQFIKDNQSIRLTDVNGRTFSHQSSSYWDVVKAVEIEMGFQVLVEGESTLAGRYQAWRTDGNGVIINKSGWKTGDQMLGLGYEDIFKRDLNEDGFTGEPPAADVDGDGMIDGASVYKMFKDDQGILLTNRWGGVFSNQTSSYWDVVKAVATDEGFLLLVQGESYLDGRFQIWTANFAGVITDKSRWKTGDQMLVLGYEDVFNRDLNRDGTIGEPPAIDLNGDGLVDGASIYKMFKDDQGILLTNSLGSVFSNQTSSYWDVVKAVATDEGFELLVQGDSYLDGRYQIWTANSSGVLTEKSRWKTGDQMLVLGYEDVFNRDLNRDGTTGEPPAIDLNGDGLVDGASVYKMLKDEQGIMLTNRWGNVFSNQTSSYWDVVKAVATDEGFELLVQGESSLVGRYQVWSVDASGVIGDKSRWNTGDQMLLLGYEDKFNSDLNRDSIIGEPPVVDADGDGLIDGATFYRILKNDKGVLLTDGGGRTFTEGSSPYWNVAKSVAYDAGFQVLVEGERSLAGQYQVWSLDSAGVIGDRSRWMMGDQMLSVGYEDVFNRDFNGDGLIASTVSSLN